MRVAVVGAGIAGLAAALELHDRLGDRGEIVVIDGAVQAGGKLRTGMIAGRRVETGAETFLARAADDPSGGPSEAVMLAQRFGLPLTHPATTAAGVLIDGRLRSMPGGTLMGVPADVSTMDDVWGRADRPDLDLGHPVLAAGADVSVGALVRDRISDLLLDRLVDPLLGGVYAGRADGLSLAATIPSLAAACRTESTLSAAVRAAMQRRSTAPGPVFATVDGGLTTLVDAIIGALPPGTVRLGLPVRSLAATAAGWELTIGSTRDPVRLAADAVVLAVPSRPAARLLAGVAAGPGGVTPGTEPEAPGTKAAASGTEAAASGTEATAADAVGALDYASIGLVTYLLPAGALDGTGLEGRSGALVPAVEGHLIKAITVFSTKWAPEPDGAVLLRCSVGRYGDEAALQHTDEQLSKLVADDLAEIAGRPLPAPLASSVTRWGGALPQYAPGHLDRVATARNALPDTIALAGAAYDGVGIPLCIRSGQAAAAQIINAVGRMES